MSSYEDEVDMDLGNKTGLQFQTDKVNTSIALQINIVDSRMNSTECPQYL